jgi:phage terminase small subunit
MPRSTEGYVHPDYSYLINFYDHQFRHGEQIDAAQFAYIEQQGSAPAKRALGEIMLSMAKHYGVEPRPEEEWQVYVHQTVNPDADIVDPQGTLNVPEE